MAKDPPPIPRLSVRGLSVTLPSGRSLLDNLSLDVRSGEVVVILGGSGSGKSTFSRVLFERDELERQGFTIAVEDLFLSADDLGLVPQRGALFDHLDVRGNLDLALRYARRPARDGTDVAQWLAAVGLDPSLAKPGTRVSSLSGGQAQRVAVARVLAGQRKLLFFDEPSVGLDPHRVRMLARLIREHVSRSGLAAIVVTHDVALAAGVADRLYYLDPATRRLEPLFADTWPGPVEAPGVTADERGLWLIRLEHALVAHIDRAAAEPTHPTSTWRRRLRALMAGLRQVPGRLVAPFAACAIALRYLPAQLAGRPGDFFTIAWRVLMQTLVRPALFYAIVSCLIGYTVLFIISKVGGAGVRPDALIRQLGGSYVVALAPALSAILFVSASGSATNAWLGGMALTKQTLAMDALGINRRAYLWSPAWLSIALAYFVTAGIFALGMIAGGLVLCAQYEMTGAWELITGDLVDPTPERVRFVVRAALLLWIYGWGMASDIIAKGGAPKADADAVTRAMTASVVSATLWVVAWELISVLLLFRS